MVNQLYTLLRYMTLLKINEIKKERPEGLSERKKNLKRVIAHTAFEELMKQSNESTDPIDCKECFKAQLQILYPGHPQHQKNTFISKMKSGGISCNDCIKAQLDILFPEKDPPSKQIKQVFIDHSIKRELALSSCKNTNEKLICDFDILEQCVAEINIFVSALSLEQPRYAELSGSINELQIQLPQIKNRQLNPILQELGDDRRRAQQRNSLISSSLLGGGYPQPFSNDDPIEFGCNQM